VHGVLERIDRWFTVHGVLERIDRWFTVHGVLELIYIYMYVGDLSVVKISREWVTGPEQGKRNWIHHVNRMPRNRLPRVMKQYFPTGRNHGRLLRDF